MTNNLIGTGIVKQFSKGGAYVAVPAHLIGKEVWIIPKDEVAEAKISVIFSTKGEPGPAKRAEK